MIYKRLIFCIAALIITNAASSQKKPLDHSVYDQWKGIGERAISNDGKYIMYTINPQEGDATLVIHSADNNYKKEIPRGYNAAITEDNRFIVFRIRPYFSAIREARIRKKKPDEMPRDSLGIIELGKDSIIKIPRVKGFRLPEKSSGWVAYQLDKPLPEINRGKFQPDSITQINNLLRLADSLAHIADSLRNKASQIRNQGLSILQPSAKAKAKSKPSEESFEEGADMILRNLLTGEEKKYSLVNEYLFSEKGNRLLIETSRKKGDTLLQSMVLLVDPKNGKTDTIMRRFNEAKHFIMDEDGKQLAFLAERDSASKALRKFYSLYYFAPGMDSALLRVDRNTSGMPSVTMISDKASPIFSKDGRKLFFGLTPIRKPKDTTLVDFETARLDIWHYNDDYLQTQQLVQLNNELSRSFLAVLNGDHSKVIPLGNDTSENIMLIDEGNADYVLGTSSKGNRVQVQWQGFAMQTAYIISTNDGSRKLVKRNHRGFFLPSPKGKFITWYDVSVKNHFSYNINTGITKNMTAGIQEHLFNDEDDHPDDPSSFGNAGWIEDDIAMLINDRYDIWRVDPMGVKPPLNITAGFGKKNRTVLRFIRTDREARFIKKDQQLMLESFNRDSKHAGFYTKHLTKTGDPLLLFSGPYAFSTPIKSKNADKLIVTRMNITESPDLYFSGNLRDFTKLSSINGQQKEYNWLTAELLKWKMFDGKEAEGVIFKPENFDSTKKYPVIFYFYEKNADNLYNYRPPAPSASTINIPYFVSNGYIVVDPNIYYKDGEPGESAYNSVVSAAKYLSTLPWIDSTKMAIQGQSWGGYQVAYLVTRTNMFAAAGAGAPVANMTSAYGGIRWGTGVNRQFQYERSQSRIGATLWERTDLYLKNSPLFNADKIATPLLIMHNDNDGAVPWYQGIELFTALRRLGKKAWMLQYNGEGHNLVERRNRKDLSIRLSQFFDHYLKGAPAAKWIKEGVPATLKGIDWGVEVQEAKTGF